MAVGMGWPAGRGRQHGRVVAGLGWWGLWHGHRRQEAGHRDGSGT